MSRDMSLSEFDAALRRHGFTGSPRHGLWHPPADAGNRWCVTDRKTGVQRREKLKWALKMLERERERFARIKARKHLNSAAPDLLAALEGIFRIADGLPCNDGPSDFREAMSIARAAVAKAKGEPADHA